MALCKNKKKSSARSKKQIELLIKKHLPKICLAIAIFDFTHAFYFVIQATISLVTSFNVYSIFALLGTIFWVLIVGVFIVGLWKRRPLLVKAWLIFSVAGFVADICVLIWGIVSSISVNWENLQKFIIIFFGIFLESFCIFLVHKYYLVMDPCRSVYHVEKGKKKGRKKQVDPRGCRESKKKKPKAKPKKKTKK